MKKKLLIFVIISILLLTFSCSKKMERGLSIARSAPGLAYDDSYSTTSWEGTGYNASVSAEAPVFRDMSNLYGRMKQETEQRSSAQPVTRSTAQAAGSEPTDLISADLTKDERKLVKRADIRIRVDNLEKADTFVNDMLKRYDAYSASTNINENSNYYSLRVPAPVYDAFLAETDGMGRTLNRSENVDDVTLQYYDLEGRLATKKELLKTYQSYLGRAKNIEEILSVEARIADLQRDIDGTGKQLRELGNRVDYATISLSLLGPVSSMSKRGDTFGTRLKDMFSGFGDFLSGLFFVIVGIVIYGVPILLLVALLFLLLFGRVGLVKKLWRVLAVKK